MRRHVFKYLIKLNLNCAISSHGTTETRVHRLVPYEHKASAVFHRDKDVFVGRYTRMPLVCSMD